MGNGDAELGDLSLILRSWEGLKPLELDELLSHARLKSRLRKLSRAHNTA